MVSAVNQLSLAKSEVLLGIIGELVKIRQDDGIIKLHRSSDRSAPVAHGQMLLLVHLACTLPWHDGKLSKLLTFPNTHSEFVEKLPSPSRRGGLGDLRN